jgi:hypothetical protein
MSMNWQDAQKITNAAYVNAMVACAMIEAMGMQAENSQRSHLGLSMAYDDKAFNDVIEKYGIHHNAVLGALQNGM